MTLHTNNWELLDAATGLLAASYGSQVRVRMLAVRLRDGELLVVSPGALQTDAQFAALEQHGRPTFLLAPNHFHNLGLRQWHARYPDATLCAHPDALPRLRKKLAGLPLTELAQLHAALPPHVQLLHPPHTSQGELWLSVAMAQGRAWFVTDGIINEEQLPGGALGLAMRLLGFRARLMTNPHFRRMYVTDKAAHQAWVLAQLERDQPVLFVPSHGVPLRGDDVTPRLREAVLGTAAGRA